MADKHRIYCLSLPICHTFGNAAKQLPSHNAAYSRFSVTQLQHNDPKAQTQPGRRYIRVTLMRYTYSEHKIAQLVSPKPELHTCRRSSLSLVFLNRYKMANEIAPQTDRTESAVVCGGKPTQR